MNDTTRSAHKSETAASSQEARLAQKSNQKITGASGKETLSPQLAALIQNTFGTSDMNFWDGIFSQLAGASSGKGAVDKQQHDFMMSIILEPKSRAKFEIMLAAQMATVHGVMMTFAQYLVNEKSIEGINSIGNIFNKLARTSAMQMDVLQRYQSGGEQKVTVQQNVSVSEGGQAIVGNVMQNARDDNKAKAATSLAAITDAHTTPMQIIEQSEKPAMAPAKRRPHQ